MLSKLDEEEKKKKNTVRICISNKLDLNGQRFQSLVKSLGFVNPSQSSDIVFKTWLLSLHITSIRNKKGEKQ